MMKYRKNHLCYIILSYCTFQCSFSVHLNWNTFVRKLTTQPSTSFYVHNQRISVYSLREAHYHSHIHEQWTLTHMSVWPVHGWGYSEFEHTVYAYCFKTPQTKHWTQLKHKPYTYLLGSVILALMYMHSAKTGKGPKLWKSESDAHWTQRWN